MIWDLKMHLKNEDEFEVWIGRMDFRDDFSKWSEFENEFENWRWRCIWKMNLRNEFRKWIWDMNLENEFEIWYLKMNLRNETKV